MDVTVRAAADVVAALNHVALVPHHSADTSTGPTMQLRAAMARFSSGPQHAPRRAAVVATIEALDVAAARRLAMELTVALLVGDEIDVLADIARVVPTSMLWQLLQLPGRAAIDDVEAVVRVIGRGEPATVESDEATKRLLAVGDVATVSVLYQDFDATAALIATTLGAGDPPAPAVLRTRRVAVADSTVGDHDVPAGTTVVVEIGAAGLPFGAGPHECPARALAEAIVAGVVAAFGASGWAIDPAQTVLDPDGRPTRLQARPGPLVSRR